MKLQGVQWGVFFVAEDRGKGPFIVNRKKNVLVL
jgi:hypothetical protein